MTDAKQRAFFIAKTLTNNISLVPHYVLWIKLHKEFQNKKKKERNINIKEMRCICTKTDTMKRIEPDVYKSYAVHDRQTRIKRERNEAI